MKTYRHLFERMISEDNLRRAIHEAAKRKTKRHEVQVVLANEDKYIRRLQKMLTNGTFTPHVGNPSYVRDGSNNKMREIHKPIFFPDQVIHHALIQAAEEVFTTPQYRYSLGSVKGHGTAEAVKVMEKWMQNDRAGTKYGGKADVRHFYANISHRRLKRKLARKIKDTRWLNVAFLIIDAYGKFVGKAKKKVKSGLPFGLFTSPHFANFFLTDFDHFVKEKLHVKKYERYLDDLQFFDSVKKRMHRILEAMKLALRSIELWMKNNWQIIRIKTIDGKGKIYQALGFRFERGKDSIRIGLRKSALLDITKLARQIGEKREKKEPIGYHQAASMLSRLGELKPATLYHVYEKYVKDNVDKKQLRRIVSKHDRRLNNVAKIRVNSQPAVA